MVELGVAVYAVGEVEAKTGNALQDALVLPLARHCLGKARVVLIYVHVFVCLAEQLAHGGGFEFAGQGVAGGIAVGISGWAWEYSSALRLIRSSSAAACAASAPRSTAQELVAAIAAGEA